MVHGETPEPARPPVPQVPVAAVADTPPPQRERPLDGGSPAALRAAVPETEGGSPAPVGARRPRRPYAHALRRFPPPRQAAATAARATRAASQAVGAWSTRPSGRLALPGLLLTGVVAVTAAAGAILIPAIAPPRAPVAAPADDAPSAVGATGLPAEPTLGPTVGPTGTVPTSVVGGRPADVLAGWAQQMSGKVDVPAVAMQAYGYAELVQAQTTPACRLSWTTLAAIGKVESDHGRANRATLLSDGRALPAIVGPPLDGTGGRQIIRDTDAGALDGDGTYDRAVGPMQFIPATWHGSAIDADNDGVRDPNDIDDAALAAANYLCKGGRDLSTAAGWWGAVLGYNDVRRYAQAVFATANDYGQRSRT